MATIAKLSLDEYERMVAAGVFEGFTRRRIELIRGELREMDISANAKLSLDEYERIVAAGIFEGPRRRRIELIRGELFEMNPIGPDHSEVLDRLNKWSFRHVLEDDIRVRVQSPLAFLNADSEPEPDLVWAREQDYSVRHPAAADVLLLVEVAGSSLDRDRTTKLDLYADVGIQEYWIVNLVDRTIEVYCDPESGHFRIVQMFAAAEMAHPLGVPEAALSFDKLLAAR